MRQTPLRFPHERRHRGYAQGQADRSGQGRHRYPRRVEGHAQNKVCLSRRPRIRDQRRFSHAWCNRILQLHPPRTGDDLDQERPEIRVRNFIRLPALVAAYSSLMKSMTGYGRGDCSQDGFKITVELSSVNRKQSEISVNLPREMEMLEAQIRDLINRFVARGRLTVRVGLHAGASILSARMHLNVPLAKAYARELNRLSRQLHLPGPVTLDHLARAPGVFQTDEQIAEEEDFWPAVEKALRKALFTLVKMRAREGAHLAQDLAL